MKTLLKNKLLLLLCGGMVLIYFANSVLNNYLTLYYNDIGLTNAEIGVIAACGPFAVLLLQTLWGRFADKTGRKRVLVICLCGTALSALLFLLTKSFIPTLCVALLYMVFNMSINPIHDSMCIDFCNREGYKFGPVRLCGTIGFALAPPILGVLFTHNLRLVFPIFSALSLLAAAAVLFLPSWLNQAASPQAHEETPKTSFAPLLRDPLVIFILLVNLVLSLGSSVSQFFPVMARELGMSNNTIGLIATVSTISEIPSLLLIDRVLKRVRAEKIMLSALYFQSARLLLDFSASLFTGAALGLFIAEKALQSVTYITTYYCSARLLHERFPSNMKASAQTLLAVVSTGIARIIGSLLSGWVSQSFGIGRAFGIMFIFELAGAVALTAMFILMNRAAKRKNAL